MWSLLAASSQQGELLVSGMFEETLLLPAALSDFEILTVYLLYRQSGRQHTRDNDQVI